MGFVCFVALADTARDNTYSEVKDEVITEKVAREVLM
jgi:hypothetical protein